MWQNIVAREILYDTLKSPRCCRFFCFVVEVMGRVWHSGMMIQKMYHRDAY